MDLLDDDPNPGIVGGIYEDGVWLSLERYVPPPPRPPRRAPGAGQLFYAPSAGLWMGRLQSGAERRRVASKTFCGMLKKFSKLEKPEGFLEACKKRPDRSAYDRYAQTQCARELGTHTDADWRDLLQAQGFHCYYCRDHRADLVKDHKTPISRGGSDAIDNIVAACSKCNWQKGNKTFGEYCRLRRFVA